MTTLTVNLPPPLLDHVSKMANDAGISQEAALVRLLEEYVESEKKRIAAMEYLEKLFTEGDEKEQKETGEFLIKALDENRPEGQKLFPPEKKGITW